MTPDPVRLHGTVIAQADGTRPFRRATLVAEGKTVATVDEGEIEFSLFEGGTVVIEVPAEGTKLLDPEVTITKGAWSELRELPEAAGIARNAVAPFAEVELHTIGAAPGETVEVYGEPFAYEFDEATATLRDAPKRRPSRVLAKIIAFGRADETMKALREAISELRQTRPKETRPEAPPPREDPGEPWVVWLPTGLLLLLALGAGGTLLGAGMSPIQDWRTKMLLALFVTLALVLRPTPDVPDFRASEKPLRGLSFGVVFLGRMATGALMVWLAMAVPGGHMRRDIELPPVVYLAGALAVVAVWAFTVFASQRSAYAALATLAGAPRVTLSAAEGRTGTFEGTVSDATPTEIAGKMAAMGVVTEMSKGLGKQPDVEKSVKLLARGTFDLAVGAASVRIDPDECIWATTVRDEPARPTWSYTISEWIPVGGEVAAYGRLVRWSGKETKAALRLTSMGTQAAILFATGAREGPVRLASRVVWQRRATLAVLAVAAGAIVALYLRRP